MDREVFLDHLLRASARSRELATQFILDSLPSKYEFWVLLNCSYDRNPLMVDELVFSDDVQKHGKRVGPLMADDVVSLLWRDRMVPEWIDISVWETDENATYFELMCCGRFTANAQRLYYRWTDVPPFGIKGPVYPTRIAMAATRGEPIEKYGLTESRQTVLFSRRSQLTE
jgi:hypothetical protein